jgi:RNA polymerase sigma-70 factor, ECF subfamily
MMRGAETQLLEPEVVEHASRGDDGAFDQIVLACRKRVFGAIARLISRPEDVEDVAQEVFVRLHQSLGRLRSPELFEPWMYRITLNAARDYLRRRQRTQEVRFSDLGDEQAESAMASAAARNNCDDGHQRKVREQVDSMLSLIPPDDRVLLVLKEIEGLSLEELERIYGVRPSILKGRLFRARRKTLRALSA